MRKIQVFILILLTFNSYSQENVQIPDEIKKVFDYILEKDFPEVFNGNPFQIRPIRWQVIDIDNDDITEVFLQTFPHYRQSPTITIYQIHKNDSISRIIEGLAPGHLIPLSAEDDYFDTHTTGTAVDMQIGSNEPEKMLALAESSIKWGMSPVLYKNFIHTDQREKGQMFLDLRYLDDYSKENSCANFQFSTPEAIICGLIENQDYKFFIAKVEKELFCYKIKGFKDNGFIDKEVSIIKLPKGFLEFVVDGGVVKYKTTKNKIKPLEI